MPKDKNVTRLEARVTELELFIKFMFHGDRFKFDRPVNMKTLTIGGTNIATDKLAFFGSTPVDQPATVPHPSGGTTQDSVARVAIVYLIDRLQELGLIA
jgi:hypothetical protein